MSGVRGWNHLASQVDCRTYHQNVSGTTLAPEQILYLPQPEVRLECFSFPSGLLDVSPERIMHDNGIRTDAIFTTTRGKAGVISEPGPMSGELMS